MGWFKKKQKGNVATSAAAGAVQRPPLFDRCLLALVALLLTTVVRGWLDTYLHGHLVFVIYLVPIVFVAWHGGLRVALAAMAVGAALASYLFDESAGSLMIYGLRSYLSFSVYVIVGVFVVYLIDWLTRDIARRQQVEAALGISQEKLRGHQAELAHIARVSIMGEMAAGLIHELNQPLYAAKNYAQGSLRRLRKAPGSDSEVTKALEQICLEADRAAEILRRVWDFVHKNGPVKEVVSMNHLIEEATHIFQMEFPQLRGNIALELAPGLPTVIADPIQIEQVVVNLARNGMEAMAELPPAGRRLCLGSVAVDGAAIEVFVRDCGKGIAATDLPKVFDPFFTTKADGMGMGLAICRSIVESHEGRLWTTANDGGGCTFHFTVPLNKETTP